MRKIKWTHYRWLMFFAGLFLMLGWGVQNGMAQTARQNRLVIVLIDQTDSFGINTEKGVAQTLYWDEALQKIKGIVDALKAKDEFVLLAINDQGFVDENILIKLQQFDRSGLKARMQTRNLGGQIMQLARPEKKYKRTDILGSLFQAAYIAEREKMAKTVVVCFSDMLQEPQMPTLQEARELKFPAHTKGYFYFVDASGLNAWKQVLQTWTPLLRQANMELGDENTPNFFQYGETDRALQRMLREW